MTSWLEKERRLDAVSERLQAFESYHDQDWALNLKSAPIVLCLKEVKDVVVSFGSTAVTIARVQKKLEKLANMVHVWFTDVLVHSYNLILDVCNATRPALKNEPYDNLLAMAIALLDFGVPDAFKALAPTMELSLPAVQQCWETLQELPKLVGLWAKSEELSYEDGQYLQTHVASFKLNSQWAGHVGDCLPESQRHKTLEELQDDLEGALQHCFFPESVRDSLMKSLTDDTALQADLADLLDSLPHICRATEPCFASAAVPASWGKDDLLESLLDKANVVGDKRLAQQLSYIKIFKSVSWGRGQNGEGVGVFFLS